MSGVKPRAFLASTSTVHLLSMKFITSTCPVIIIQVVVTLTPSYSPCSHSTDIDNFNAFITIFFFRIRIRVKDS
jgi:hypothetical protein